MTNHLLELKAKGQSVWLDYIRRDLMSSGELQRMIAEDGLSGITANPSIFEKAIDGSDLYDADIAKSNSSDPVEAYEVLAFADQYFGAVTGGPSTVGISDRVGWAVVASAGGAMF